MNKLSDFILPPPPSAFRYKSWRHGGWYTNVRYPSGASGCVSNNYADGKWRIACDPRTFEEQPTFSNRADAALAEWHLVEGLKTKQAFDALQTLLWVIDRADGLPDDIEAAATEARAALAKATGDA